MTADEEVEVQVSDAGWRIYYLEGRLFMVLRGLEPMPGAEVAFEIVQGASDAVSHALGVFDREEVSDDPRASKHVAAQLRQARLSDAVRLVEGLPTYSPNCREVTDLRRCLTEIDELASFFGEQWPRELQLGHQGVDVAQA
jgi:hypothetical protein